jgi:uncharacterized membrane protein
VEVALVWIVALVCAAFVATAAIANHGRRRELSTDPKDLLARRYAAGEIGEAEYLTRLSILRDANELAP